MKSSTSENGRRHAYRLERADHTARSSSVSRGSRSETATTAATTAVTGGVAPKWAWLETLVGERVRGEFEQHPGAAGDGCGRWAAHRKQV